MPKKRTELPPELVAEWADDRTIEEVLATPQKLGGGVMARVKWRCQVKNCGREWNTTLNKRLSGQGCLICAARARAEKNRGTWRKHPDFHLIAAFTPKNADSQTRISLPCSACNKMYLVTVSNWLRGHRRHNACAHPRRVDWQRPHGYECLDVERQATAKANTSLRWRHSCGHEFSTRLSKLDAAARRGTSGCAKCAGSLSRSDWQQPPGFVCLEPEKRIKAAGITPLRWQHACGYEFHTNLQCLDTAACNGTPGCPKCSNKIPLSIRFREEAPDLLRHATTAAKGLAILAARGADKGELGKAYRNALALTQKGVSATEAVRRVADDMDRDEDAEDDVDVKSKKTKKSTPEDVGLLSSKDLAQLTPTDPTDPTDPAIDRKSVV